MPRILGPQSFKIRRRSTDMTLLHNVQQGMTMF